MAVFYSPRQWATAYNPILVEMPNHMVIDGTPYEKTNLTPEFLQGMEIHTIYNEPHMIMNRFWNRKTFYWNSGNARDFATCDPSSTKWDDGQGFAKAVWVSKYNPDEAYVAVSYSQGSTYKIDIRDYKRLNTTNYPDTGGAISAFAVDCNNSGYNRYVQDWRYFGSNLIFNETPSRIDTAYSQDGSPWQTNCRSDGWTGNYVFWGGQTRGSDSWCLGYIAKSNFTYYAAKWQQFAGFPGTRFQILWGNEQYVLISLCGTTWPDFTAPHDNWDPYIDSSTGLNNGSRHYVYQFNRQTGTLTGIYDIWGSTWTCSHAPSSSRRLNEVDGVSDAKWMFYVIAQPYDSSKGYLFRKCQFNNDSFGTIWNNDFTVDFSKTSLTSASIKQLTVHNRATTLKTFLVKPGNGKMYLGFMQYETNMGGWPLGWGGPWGYENIYQFGLYCFELDGASLGGASPKMYLRGKIDNDGNRPRDILPIDKDYTRFIVIFDAVLKFYQFDIATEMFKEVNKIAINANSVGIDDLDRVWVYDWFGKLHLLSPFVPTKIGIAWDKERYDYTGTAINTHVDISTTDQYGAYMSAPVSLVIESKNAVFTANNATHYSLTTSAAGTTQVDITITGPGYIRVLANTGV